MSLFEQIQKDYTQARRDKDELKKKVLNVLFSDLKYIKVNKQLETVDDKDSIAAIQKSVKQANESLEAARSRGDADLIAEIEAEIEVLTAYLPEALSMDELLKIARDVKAEVGASSPSDMGLMMKSVMPKVQGRADGGDVKNAVMTVLKEG